MADIVIKKKVELDFLGEHYKDSSLTFRAIPVSEYTELMKKAEKAEDNQESMQQIITTLEKYFIEGLFEGQKLTKDDIKQFDGQTILKSFEVLTGQTADQEGNVSIDPKSESK